MKNLEQIEKWYDINASIFDNLIRKSKLIIEEAIEENGITINSITGRVKEKESYCKKALKEKYGNPIKEITDMAGIRIISYVNSDVDKICKIIEEEFDIDKENSINKGDLLGIDKVGYKSIHYVVKMKEERTRLREYSKFKNIRFEIQIRTLLQHAWSEIEHDRNYKFSGVLPEEIKREFSLLAGTLELVDIHFENILKKIDMYSNDIHEKCIENNLDNIPIDSIAIKALFNEEFNEEIKNEIIVPELLADNDVIRELNDFGINNMKQLKELLNNKFIYDKRKSANFTALLRDTMIKNDADKYFIKSWNNTWQGIDLEDRELFIKNGVPIDEIANKYGIDFVSNNKDYPVSNIIL